MGRKLKYGSQVEILTLRIPRNIYLKGQAEGLDYGRFLTNALALRYEKTEPRPILESAAPLETTIEFLARHFDALDQYAFTGRSRGSVRGTVPTLWPPGDKTPDPFVDKISDGKIRVTRGYLRKHWAEIVAKAEALK